MPVLTLPDMRRLLAFYDEAEAGYRQRGQTDDPEYSKILDRLVRLRSSVAAEEEKLNEKK